MLEQRAHILKCGLALRAFVRVEGVSCCVFSALVARFRKVVNPGFIRATGAVSSLEVNHHRGIIGELLRAAIAGFVSFHVCNLMISPLILGIKGLLARSALPMCILKVRVQFGLRLMQLVTYLTAVVLAVVVLSKI